MRDILLTLFLFAIVPVCLFRPWIGILAWSWLGFMNPHKMSWGFAQEMPFALLIALATLLGLLVTRERRGFPASGLIAMLILLMAYFTFTTLFAWAPEAAWEQWGKVLKVIVMALVTTLLIFGKQRILALVAVIVFSVGFYGFKGGIFSILTGGAHRVQGPEGTFIGGNTFLGLAMIMVLPLILFLAREVDKVWLRRFLHVVAGLTLISIVLTYSRGAWLGLALVVPLLFLRSPKKVGAVFLILVLAVLGKQLLPAQLFERADTIKTYEEDASSMLRIQAWSVAWNVAKAHPLTGAGFNFENSPNMSRWMSYADREYDRFGDYSRAAHSIYFQMLGQHGLVAFILFLSMLGYTLIVLQRLKRRRANDDGGQWIAGLASALQIGLIGYMVSGAFLSSAYFDLVYVYVVLAAILQREYSVAQQSLATIKSAPLEAGERMRRKRFARVEKSG